MIFFFLLKKLISAWLVRQKEIYLYLETYLVWLCPTGTYWIELVGLSGKEIGDRRRSAIMGSVEH